MSEKDPDAETARQRTRVAEKKDAPLVSEISTEEQALQTSESVRFSLNLSQESANILRDVAGRKNVTFTEAVRRAIAIMKVIDDELNAGNNIQTVDSQGTASRFVFL